MRLPLVWLRHLLVVLPAIATLYIADIPSNSRYVAFVLLALLYARITDAARAAAPLLLPLGMIGYGWLFREYGGLLYFLQYSLLVAAFLHLRKPVQLGPMVLLSGIVLNAIGSDHGLTSLWVMNLAWLAFALLLLAYTLQERHQSRLNQQLELLSDSQDQLEQERARTLEYARKVEDYAQTQERGRIATELHDDLGHRLIRVKMMSEAALQIMEHSPDKAGQLIAQVRDQLEESMNNMRYTVRRLQPVESKNGRRYALHRLIEDAARDMQIEVIFELSGKPFPLYPSLEFVLYRNAQEAITNAVRHGGATSVQIVLDFSEDRLAMTIANNGKPPSEAKFGMGLKGMQDRLAVIGGTLRVTLEPQFLLTAIIPYQERPQAQKEQHS
ncbi:sensor histidine kinase [Cohnella boryungensis]|uniref:histidine kinase n=1 Tax=Cohnella boryungensis TaxID=768479 RepID=A0ABV8SDS6_9BACL